MNLPILGAFISRKIAWRVIKWGLIQTAKEFSKKVDAIKHGKLSGKWLWDNAYCPLINDIRNNKTDLDDPAADFIYYTTAGYLYDGKLAEMIRATKCEVARGETIPALARLSQMLVLIEQKKDEKK